MYEKDSEKAAQALDRFYNTVYDLQHDENSVNSIVVSDCAIFWIDKPDCINDLSILLEKLPSFHRRMLPDYLIRTTVAYGHFRYQRRLEMPRIRKDMIIGGAYLDTYVNNDRIEHGSIVIVKLPEDTNFRNLHLRREYKEMIKANCLAKGFYEYFWSLQNKGQINSFVNERKEIQNTVFQKLKELYSE